MSENSQYAHLPILSGSKDYAKWSLAIKGQAKLTSIWRVYAGMWTESSPIAATATQEDKDTYATDNKHWGQGVVSRPSTLQIYCKEIDKEFS